MISITDIIHQLMTSVLRLKIFLRIPHVVEFGRIWYAVLVNKLGDLNETKSFLSRSPLLNDRWLFERRRNVYQTDGASPSAPGVC
jgi:hypothetical protein